VITAHHVTVQRTARYFLIGEPGPATRDVWVVCHGYAQLAANFIRRFQSLAAPHRVIAAPEGLSRFYVGDHTRPAGPDTVVGASWMTKEDRDAEVADYLAYLDTVCDTVTRGVAAPVALHLLGFSQGTATVSRWAARGRVRPHRVVLWGGLSAPDADWAGAADRLEGAELVLVAGRADPYLTPKVRASEETRLRQAGVRFRVVEYDGGHEIHEPTLVTLGRNDVTGSDHPGKGAQA
jgi:predicted esterase